MGGCYRRTSGVAFKGTFSAEIVASAAQEDGQQRRRRSSPALSLRRRMAAFERGFAVRRNSRKPIRPARPPHSINQTGSSGIGAGKVISTLQLGHRVVPSSCARPYVRCVKHLAVRPTACPIRGLRRIGRRRASDMGDGPDARYHLRGNGCPQSDDFSRGC